VTADVQPTCGCEQGMGHMDRECSSYGICHAQSAERATKVTAVDVDALDAARAAATPGPWTVLTGQRGYVSHPDAALIVAAVNALPELIAEVRWGRALREAVDGLAKQWAEMARDHDEQGASNTALVYGAHARHLRAALRASNGEGMT
jgi:hypothetical protein